jgi:hypothetical protein
MATNAVGTTIASRATRILAAAALTCMYLFGTLAATGAALTFSAAPAEAGRRGRRGRRGRSRGRRGRRGRRGWWRGRRGRRGRWGPGFCFYIHGVSFCGR